MPTDLSLSVFLWVNMKIYLININDVTEKELNHWFDCMSDSRKEEVRNIKNKSKYVSKIISDHICRKSVSEFCGIPENKIVFSKNEYGKPFADNTNTINYAGFNADGSSVIITSLNHTIRILDITPKVPYEIFGRARYIPFDSHDILNNYQFIKWGKYENKYY